MKILKASRNAHSCQIENADAALGYIWQCRRLRFERRRAAHGDVAAGAMAGVWHCDWRTTVQESAAGLDCL